MFGAGASNQFHMTTKTLNPAHPGKGKRSLDKFADLIRAIYLFFPGILFIVLYYLIIVALPLGQDLLMQAGEATGPFIWTVVSLLLWAIVAWFSSRMLADIQRDVCVPAFYLHLPRLLGYNVLAGLQLAVLSLPTFCYLQGWQFWMVLAIQNVFYFLLIACFRKDGWIRWLTVFCMGAYFFILVCQLYHSKTGAYSHTRWLSVMAIFFFLVQILFTWAVCRRRDWLDEHHKSGKKVSRKAWLLFQVVSALALILYICIVFSTGLAFRFGALACAMLAFCLLAGFIHLMRYIGRKLNLRFGLLLLVSAILIGKCGDPYQVELENDTNTEVFNKRPDLDTFVARWLRYRKTQIEKGNYTAYVVIADGGASRSGYWVASVLSKLEQHRPEDKFSDHLFSLAGASGGSVGNAVFYALLDSNLRRGQLDYRKESRAFFDGDHLTYSLARFLGPDLLRHFVPFIRLHDRAATLATSMENSGSEAINILFSRKLSSFFDTTGARPMLLMNTTNLQSGRPGEVSSIQIDPPLSARIDVLDLVDSCGNKDAERRNIRLSTAALLGARFPFLSPAGRLENYYFNDGGYFDNTGAGITFEILDQLDGRLRNGSCDSLYPLLRKVNFKVIYISNGTLTEKKLKRVDPLLNDLTAPILTIMNTRGEQTELSNQRLRNFLKKSTLSGQTCFPNTNLPFTKEDKVPYPMNWVISDFNLARMDSNLRFVKPDVLLLSPANSNTLCSH